MKLLIIGHKRSGKDTLAAILENYGLTFDSSSLAAARIFIFDKLRSKYGYTTIEECFEDRVNHRQEWFDLICAYNKHDKARLYNQITKIRDGYVGMRNVEEFEAVDPDLVIWVDAAKRLPPETGSMNIPSDHPKIDIVLPNNGSEREFLKRCHLLGKILQKRLK